MCPCTTVYSESDEDCTQDYEVEKGQSDTTAANTTTKRRVSEINSIEAQAVHTKRRRDDVILENPSDKSPHQAHQLPRSM